MTIYFNPLKKLLKRFAIVQKLRFLDPLAGDDVDEEEEDEDVDVPDV